MPLQVEKDPRLTSPDGRTLVMYVFHESSDWYVDNLRFFIEVAIDQQQQHPSAATPTTVDYIFIVNGETRIMGDLRALAQRHANVRILQRANRCYDGGSVGEVLRDNPDLARSYRYYVLMNSSVRGPFLPRYFRAQPWTTAFTDLLGDDVKLVGTTISCQESLHVQSMVLATDDVGLSVIRSAGALDCPETMAAAIANYELASSAAILDAGYNIDSLLTRYRGIDWRLHRQLHCNAALNPQVARMNDGMSLDPFEILFIKAKASRHVPATAAFLARYTQYYTRKPGSDALDPASADTALKAELESNAFLSPEIQDELASEWAALEEKVQRCGATFDEVYYLAQNPDLVGMPREELFVHFKFTGFQERRPYRYRLADEDKAEFRPVSSADGPVRDARSLGAGCNYFR